MWHVQRFAVAVLGIGLIAVLLGNATAQGQGSDAALRDRVNQLVERLASDDADRRAEAADSLVKLGPRVLPLLPSSSLKDLEQAKRVEDVRKALAEAARKVNLGASTVTIQGDGIRLTEALKQLQQQSGNIVTDLREQYGEERTNPGMDLDIQEMPFFEALDLICKEAGLTPNFYTGDGSIGLMAGTAMMERPVEATAADRPELKVVYSGPFRIVFQQIAARREFTTGADEASARFEVAWEPRLRPMLLALSAEDMEIVDDRGETIAPAVPMESGDVVLRPENPVAEINLNMQAPDRAAQALKRLKVKGQVTLPGGLRNFRFDDLTKTAKQEVGQVSMQLLSTQVEGFVWKVRVLLKYPGDGPALESYQQGLFNNRLWLQKADGTRFEHNGGFSNLGGGNGQLAFEYLFVDVPGQPSDWGLVYETPSDVETIPLEFTFEDVPLP